MTVTPPRISLYKPWPKPFNPVTQFSVFVYKKSLVSIKIFDVFGTEVIRLINNKVYSPYIYPFSWDGLTGFSREEESEIYYISFESGRDVLSEKLLRIR